MPNALESPSAARQSLVGTTTEHDLDTVISDAASKIRESVREKIKDQEAPKVVEDHGAWTRRGCTPWSFRFTDNPAVSPHEKQAIKNRHLHMIAAGGCVGAGLFVASGSGLAYGGAAGLLIGFSLISIMIILVVQAQGELAVMYPSSGSFYSHSSRFIHPSWGFAVGWNYFFMWLIAVPLELTVCAITMDYWNLNISMAAYIAIFLGIILVVSLFGSAAYGEEEFWSSLVKVGTMIVFIIVAVVCVTGNGPANGKFNVYQGARTWTDPGPFANGFKGVCSVLVTAAVALNGTELVGLAVAETPKPAKAFPRAVKQIFWRCVIFYIIALLLIGFLVSSKDHRLLSIVSGVHDAKASPFVIVAQDSGIKGLDSFINAVILVAVVSVGISGIYGASRTLAGLADDGMAPKFLGKRDMAGRAPWAILSVIVFSNIAFMSLSTGGVNAFEWLLALTGLCALVNWGSICLAHVMFRIAWKKSNHSLDELAYKAPLGIWGSVTALVLIILAMMAQFYVAVSPIAGPPSVEAFFKAYLAIPVILTFALGNLLYRRLRPTKESIIPLEENCRIYQRESEEEEAPVPAWKRALLFLF